jgi:uncharacterized lipoprotein YddW (UPF0748 family)
MGFTPSEKEDWRRNNVDLIIKQLHDTIKSVNPHVEFGISPFGVWRNKAKDPNGSATKAGQTNYDDLYADILKWEKEGWIDYVTPQIYWHIGKEVADYAIIADWWSRNAYGCHLYTGNAMYRIEKKSKDKQWRSPKQIIKQVELNRSFANIEGCMFFSAKVMRKNPLKLQEKLTKKIYRYPSLPPINSRVSHVIPEAPSNPIISNGDGKIELKWERGNNNEYFIVYKFKKGKSAIKDDVKNIVMITGSTNISGEINRFTNPKKYYYMVSGISKTNQESVCVLFE